MQMLHARCACAWQAQHADVVPSLEALCERVALALIGPGDVCAALTLAEALFPAAARLRAAGLRLLAERLPAVLAADAGSFAALPVTALEALLQGQSLVRFITLVLLCYAYMILSCSSHLPPSYHTAFIPHCGDDVPTAWQKQFPGADCADHRKSGIAACIALPVTMQAAGGPCHERSIMPHGLHACRWRGWMRWAELVLAGMLGVRGVPGCDAVGGWRRCTGGCGAAAAACALSAHVCAGIAGAICMWASPSNAPSEVQLAWMPDHPSCWCQAAFDMMWREARV